MIKFLQDATFMALLCFLWVQRALESRFSHDPSNLFVSRTVYDTVDMAVFLALREIVEGVARPVNIWNALSTVDRAVVGNVHWTIEGTVKRAVEGEPKHPTLRDFLQEVSKIG